MKIPLSRVARVFGYLVLGNAILAQDAFHEASTHIEGEWYDSDWLGEYYAGSYPWIYHNGLTWVYCVPTSESELWLYSPEQKAWLWTSDLRFPQLYQYEMSWLYLAQSVETNYLYVYDTAEWLAVGMPPGGETYNEETVIARFLDQASMGADYELIREVCEMGIAAWIDQQMGLPVTPIEPETRAIFESAPEDERPNPWYFRRPLWKLWVTGEDQLRLRVALALSEIFVISDKPAKLKRAPVGIANYYDMLQRNAFGNFRDLLMDVTLHPVMGFYLSHAGNQKSNPEKNLFPDENYAREVMQLFSIGLYELNPDGSRKVDEEGEYIPTYTNYEITEFAKVFTGIVYDWSDDPYFNSREPIFENVVRRQKMFDKPMVLVDEEHEPGTKDLLNAYTTPADQATQEDLNDAIDNLFNHPNTGPFICRLLIQRLVKSNPSPGYIEDVASVFADNGSGVRGDMAAVIKAIYLHSEARNSYMVKLTGQGKLREPYLSYVKLFRVFNAADASGKYHYDDRRDVKALGQQFLSSPSVFNFFLPDFQPIGKIADRGLVAPEFEIVNSQSVVEQINIWHRMLNSRTILPNNLLNNDRLDLTQWSFDWADELALADDPVALVDRVDLLLTGHTLTPGTRQIIIEAISGIGTNRSNYKRERVEMAIYLILLSPDFVVQK